VDIEAAATDGVMRLRGHVEMLAGTIGERNISTPGALERAADYVASTLQTYGYAPKREPFQVERRSVANILAEIEGTFPARGIVIVGAHYDTVTGCPGANDNGTGVAGLLELARRFANQPQQRTIRFAAFVNEEHPFFQTPAMGSLVHARASRARGDRIVAMISLETIGYYSDAPGSQSYPVPLGPLYPSTGNFIGFVSDLRSARLLWRARRAFASHTSFPLQCAALPTVVPGVGWSDHWAFWQAGYRAIMVTDTAPYRYPWYHTAHDTPDKVCVPQFASVVDGLEPVVRRLADT
jgi:Zn-dependent M28 family amino/carboxypeptidase